MPSSAPQEHVPPKRILVVEDELLVANTIRMALSAEGHQVEIVENGEAAAAVFEPGKYDLVITDFMLGGMDGLELAQGLRERAAGQPIVLITANAERVAQGMGAVSNVNALIGKPFSLVELYRVLGGIFH